ncbi:hypothetical protein D3C84_1209610 [compost metagenome]
MVASNGVTVGTVAEEFRLTVSFILPVAFGEMLVVSICRSVSTPLINLPFSSTP